MARPRFASRQRFGPRPGKTLRIAIYLRVSTPAQVAGFGLKVQDDMCRDVVKMKFREQPHVIVDVYCDGGVSGKKASRPDFDRLNRDIHDGKIDVVVAAKVDRIGRTMEDIHRWVFDIDALNIRLITADGRLDNADEGFKLMLSLLAWMADTEHLLILERTTGGREAKLLDGGWVGGTVPYGLMAEGKGDTARLVVNPKEQTILSLAVEYIVDQGMTTAEAAKSLNNLGKHNRSGRKWTQNNLRQILLGNALLGYIAWREDRSNAVRDEETSEFVYGSSARVPVPEILPEDRVKAVRAALMRRTLQPRRADTTYTLSKRLIGLCGKHYIGTVKQGSNRRVYRCTGNLSNHANYVKCGCRDIEAAEIEKSVWEAVAEGFRNRGHLQELADRWLGAVPLLADNYRNRIAELEEQLDKKRKNRKKKLMLILAAVDDDDAVDEETIEELKQELASQETKLQEELDRVRGWLDDAEVQEQRVADVLALADKVRDNLDDVTPAAILDALALFDVKVHVTSKVEKPRAARKTEFETWFEESGLRVPATLTDEAWAAVADIFPPSQSARPQRDRREILDAVFYKVRNGLSWPEMKQHVHAAESCKLLAIELLREGLLPEAVRRLQDFEVEEVGACSPLPDLHIDATFMDPLAEQRILTMPGVTEGFSRVPFAEVLHREHQATAA